MSSVFRPTSDEVDELLLNARLRDELEPYIDESVDLVDVRHLPTRAENEYLESLLAWEKAPILPIYRWFEPELKLPPPETLHDNELNELLWDTIYKLHAQRVVLEYTEHLSDRELYCLLYRDILPSAEKKIELPSKCLYWHCLDASHETETWLRYYATVDERQAWKAGTGQSLPPSEPPPFPRIMPGQRP